MKTLIAPSILSADFGKLNQEISSIEKYVDLIHVDIMDGHFVKNITFGPPAVSCIATNLPLDCHLMIENPGKFIDAFAHAIKKHKRPINKCLIVVHREVFKSIGELKKVIKHIKSHGLKAGVAINPPTLASAIYGVLKDVDMVLAMTVNPGFGGQGFIETVMPKIKLIRKKAPKLDIQVDGGINDITVKLARAAGANVFVAGSYIFCANNRKHAIESLRT